jgi:hypothetical protein
VIANPRPGRRVVLRYRRRGAPLHGRRGVVAIVGRGRPRNHGVIVEGVGLVVVPCGHLMPDDKREVPNG